jgi:hypothetical protein
MATIETSNSSTKMKTNAVTAASAGYVLPGYFFWQRQWPNEYD